MFSRLLVVRLKAAEKALKDGRLDEAYRLARSEDLRRHRHGQALLTQLTDKFIERARAHFADERFAEALGDLDKAEAAGGGSDRVAELRKNITIVENEVQRVDQARRQRLEDAKQRVDAGSLAAGRRILADASEHDHDAQQLERDIASRERQAADGFAEVEALMKDKQYAAAIKRFKKVAALSPTSAQAATLESALCSHVVAAARSALESGRINRAAEELATLGDLGRNAGERRDLEDILEVAKRASAAIDAKDFDVARQQVLRLQGLCPKVGWVNKAAGQLEKLDDVLTTLLSGPLSERAAGTNHATATAPARPTPRRRRVDLNETVVLSDRATRSSGLPDRLLMLVDGGGSYLLLRKDRISLGRAMTANTADVPIRSDLAERHAEIARNDDDYFLFAPRNVDVDGRPTRHHLLRHGNRVSLSRNARFTFRMPHRQSSSSVLELSGSTKMPNDVRRIVLFRDTAMIGFGKSVHVLCNSAVHDLILFERGGRLWIRPQRNGRIDTEASPVELGKQVELLNVSFIIEPWTVPTMGPRFS